MPTICDNLAEVHARIERAAHGARRSPHAISLLTVSKTWPVERLREAWQCGQRAFGENYAHELQSKSAALADLPIEWHFIGHIQSNKTRLIARTAAWVHGIECLRIAERLDHQRENGLPPLNVCVQVNLSGEASKSGVPGEAALGLLQQLSGLPHLRLRGLMTIPAPSLPHQDTQQTVFDSLRRLLEQANAQGLNLDTLSMGMSHDLEAAIAAGSTLVRIGTAIFGPRQSG